MALATVDLVLHEPATDRLLPHAVALGDDLGRSRRVRVLVDVLTHLLDAALLDLRVDDLRHEAILLDSEGDGIKPGALQRYDIGHRLHRYYDWCARTDIPEVRRLAATIEAWWPQVLGFLTTNVTNAGTEATNRTVKTVARTAYGFRNLDNQRRSVRYTCTRQQRRVSTAA